MDRALTSRSTIVAGARRMPVLGLGTWELVRATADTVERALELGYAMIDTACDYGSQAGIGEALQRRNARSDVYLTAKVEETDDAYEATRKYLGEIGVDYADLMLIHRPPPRGSGAELWRGLARARDEGLVRSIGVSNYSIELLEDLTDEVDETPAVNQIEWSPFGHSRRMLDYCTSRRIAIQAYSPLTRGERLDDPQLDAIAQRYGRTPAQVILRWDLQLGVAPLPKASRRDHLEENIRAFEFELSDDDMSALSALNEGYSALGELAYT